MQRTRTVETRGTAWSWQAIADDIVRRRGTRQDNGAQRSLLRAAAETLSGREACGRTTIDLDGRQTTRTRYRRWDDGTRTGNTRGSAHRGGGRGRRHVATHDAHTTIDTNVAGCQRYRLRTRGVAVALTGSLVVALDFSATRRTMHVVHRERDDFGTHTFRFVAAR